MTTPIPNCPQPETPIRERAWTDEQKTEAMRTQFEAWAGMDTCLSFDRDSSGNYVERQTRTAWLAYQAALSSPTVMALVEAAEVMRGVLNRNGYGTTALEAALAPFITGATP